MLLITGDPKPRRSTLRVGWAICERLKDAIRVKGENVPAFAVEQVLCGIAGVKEAAAIAVPRGLGGDDLKAVSGGGGGCWSQAAGHSGEG